MFNRNTIAWTSILSVFIIVLLGVHMSNTTNTVAAHRGLDDEYQPVVSMEPSSVEAGQPVSLTLRMFQPDGQTPLVSFDEVHTKLLHLILVSQDLSQFLHVHPEYQGEGVFVLDDLTLPSDDNYTVFADFTPTNRTQEVVRMQLSRPGATTISPNLVVSAHEVTADPLKITVDVPENLSAGIEQSLVFHVADAETGEELDTLDEYLGAAGHLVIVDQNGEIYLHTHPAEHEMADMGGMAMQYGPDLEFVTEFPGTGLYKMWLQVQYEGEIYTAPFVVNVSEMAEELPEATEEAHESHG
jgi:P-type Cu+ transporter